MDSGYFVSGTKSNMAKSVEVCHCPDQYNGTSCQDPANGFYRWINPVVTDADSQQELIDFIGEVRPCECNDRSEMCDKETGECKVIAIFIYSSFNFLNLISFLYSKELS